MGTVNWDRLWTRFYSKMFALAVLLLAQRGRLQEHYGDATAHPTMPSMPEMTMLSVWFGAMGLVDELHDTVLEVPLHKRRVPQWVFYLAYLTLLVPIPVLITAKAVFAHYAVAFAACQILGKKLDNAVFKATVVIGLPLVGFLAWPLPTPSTNSTTRARWSSVSFRWGSQSPSLPCCVTCTLRSTLQWQWDPSPWRGSAAIRWATQLPRPGSRQVRLGGGTRQRKTRKTGAPQKK